MLLLSAKTAEESRRIGDLCAERMEKTFIADKELFELDHPLVNLVRTRPQCSCLFHSNPNKIHPECHEKMMDWFGYRAALMAFIYGGVKTPTFVLKSLLYSYC